MVFNLYVSDLKDIIPASIKCSQYAYDTTLCHHTPVQDLAGGVSLMNNALSELQSWFKESNLALNPDKTKSMLFSTRQMFTRRNLSSFPLLLSAGGSSPRFRDKIVCGQQIIFKTGLYFFEISSIVIFSVLIPNALYYNY